MKLGFGSQNKTEESSRDMYVNPNSDPYNFYLDKLVLVSCPSENHVGYYRGTTRIGNKMILDPWIDTPKSYNPYYIWVDSSIMITQEAVVSVSRKNLSEIEKLVTTDVDPACLI